MCSKRTTDGTNIKPLSRPNVESCANCNTAATERSGGTRAALVSNIFFCTVILPVIDDLSPVYMTPNPGRIQVRFFGSGLSKI